MDIGKEKPAITVEPIEDPFRRSAPEPDPAPAELPERAPEEEPVHA